VLHSQQQNAGAEALTGPAGPTIVLQQNPQTILQNQPHRNQPLGPRQAQQIHHQEPLTSSQEIQIQIQTKTTTSQPTNLFKEKPGGLRKEQQQEQQHSKLRKLNAHQNAPQQAGGEQQAF